MVVFKFNNKDFISIVFLFAKNVSVVYWKARVSCLGCHLPGNRPAPLGFGVRIHIKTVMLKV